MSVTDSIALFLLMTGLALLPSASVALVVTRSATLSTANGIAVALGIVLGDLIFVLLAILGLSLIAETMGSLFLLIRYLGGAYLLWFGFTLLTNTNETALTVNKTSEKNSLITSFLAGLFLTLGDLKAIFFYASLFPTFMDLSTLSLMDIITILFITITAVGGIKTAYACLAHKVLSYPPFCKHENKAKKIAGGVMISIGGVVITKT